jgi:hypothetical protein
MGYARSLFWTAATFNVIAGGAFLLAFPFVASVLHLDPALGAGQGRMFIECLAVVSILFGYGYRLIALDPDRYRLYIPAGAAVKIAFAAVVFWNWAMGVLDGPIVTLAIADCVLALLFIDYLRRQVDRGAAWR